MNIRPLLVALALTALPTAGSGQGPSVAARSPDQELRQGPFIGHVERDRASIWARVAAPGELRLEVRGARGAPRIFHVTASAGDDLCVVWHIPQLTPDAEYRYRIYTASGRVLCEGDEYRFRCAPEVNADGDVRLMFGSCARENEVTARTWAQVARDDVDAVVLLGDTPYIDTTRLDRQRKRYAAFASFAPMARVLRSTPWYGTWDDHDFGGNDIDGRLVGKERSRRAFVEYHALPSYGDGALGIYTSFRRGPIEVFMLDTRTFAATEPSPYKRHHASLLGRIQWRWLERVLRNSTAPVKVLACGMIWNGATRPGKTDTWGSYPHEREALFQFIGEEKIEGVVLVGGDIHRSRVLRHDAKALAGYDIYELITSPMHDEIIVAANAPHPRLIKDMGEPESFLLLEAAQAGGKLKRLVARFRNSKGEDVYRLDLRK